MSRVGIQGRDGETPKLKTYSALALPAARIRDIQYEVKKGVLGAEYKV
jgi:hypothetical protein